MASKMFQQEKIFVIPPSDEQYVRENYKTMSVVQMAAALSRGNATLYGWMRQLKLKPMERKAIDRDHPFKVQNRRLEAMLIEAKQQNR